MYYCVSRSKESVYSIRKVFQLGNERRLKRLLRLAAFHKTAKRVDLLRKAQRSHQCEGDFNVALAENCDEFTELVLELSKVQYEPTDWA